MNQYLSVFRIAKILRSQLNAIVSENEAENIMRIWVEFVTGANWHTFLIDPDRQFSSDQYDFFQKGADQLLAGEPIQYVMGEAWFLGNTFKVGPGVLIPRPETEELVDWIKKSVAPSRIQDLCTGSGCIGISLGLNFPHADLQLVEWSGQAAHFARLNLAKFNLPDSVKMADILAEDPCSPFRPDLIVSNPPYVLESDKKEMEKNVLGYEPEMALFVPDNDPLRFYSRISQLARGSLLPGGWLYFEIHERFGKEVELLMIALGFESVEVRKDFQEKDRMVRGRQPF